MNYEDMTKDELIKELENLNQCVFQFEKSEAELKQVESALRQAEEKYRNIFENAAEGIFQTSPEGRFISANPS
ncbi:MAG TPA: PAS domain S-box protein, partial [Syntrophorhabdaceae bacterium]|nr:PAS domain S-box protein [Syntrophorhabdaceae bacterium]